jgi:nitrite reductase (NADH) small subunit
VTWVSVCPAGEVGLERGVAALVEGRQVAVFRIPGADGDLWWAIDNRDPFSHANVLARGLVGSVGECAYVASPMYKQRFDLRTGRCLDDAAVSVDVWPARVVDGWVQILVQRAGG